LAKKTYSHRGQRPETTYALYPCTARHCTL